MGHVQIGKHIIVDGEVIATAFPNGQFVEALLCDACNTIKNYADGFTFENNHWQCSECKTVN